MLPSSQTSSPFAVAAAQPTLVIPRLNTTGTTTSEDGEASRISVGFNAGSSEYPWMTAVMLPNGMCGGVLVAPDAVLTSGNFYVLNFLYCLITLLF